MAAHVYIVCTVFSQEALYKDERFRAGTEINGVVTWCLVLMIAIILFRMAQRRNFDRGDLRAFFSWCGYVGIVVVLGIVTGHVAPPVFIRDQHDEFWLLYLLGVIVLFLVLAVMPSFDRKRSDSLGTEKLE